MYDSVRVCEGVGCVTLRSGVCHALIVREYLCGGVDIKAGLCQ